MRAVSVFLVALAFGLFASSVGLAQSDPALALRIPPMDQWQAGSFAGARTSVAEPSPSDEPVVPAPEPAPAARGGLGCDPGPLDDCGVDCGDDPGYRAGCNRGGLACRPRCTRAGCPEGCCEDPCGLLHLPLLCRYGIELGGWIDQGIGVVANNPADNLNGPVTFCDRYAEWQVNQTWLYMERAVDTGGCGWDVGGRIDFVYGTDARFTQAIDGLEADWGQTEIYQTALPQFYLDVAYNDWTLRMGHFFTILGYEVVPAPYNFFYSHAYTKQYGEPFTHTGMLLTRDLGPWSFSAGVHRGNDQFNDTDGHDALNFLGGVAWTDPCDRLSLAFAISAVEDGPAINTTIYSAVGTLRLTENFTYVIQHDYGQSTGLPNRARTVEWYGLNQYFLYDINCCWSAGLRFEWFRDDDGVRVVPGVEGNYYELTAGLNWKPRRNLIVRPEVRWDWFDGNGLPYDAGDKDDQFLFACDIIFTF